MEKSTMKLKILMTLAIGPILLNCQSPQKGFTTEFDVLPQMVYPKYRRWVTPDNGDVATYTSPSLQWPSKKSQVFEVRVARDKDFTKELTTIKDISFSVINIHKKLTSGLWYWQYKAQKDDWSDIASFTINDKSIDFIPPPFERLLESIPKQHPRVMVKKEDWARLQSKSISYEETSKIIEEANRIIVMQIPSELDAIIQFEGRDDNETNKIKKNFSQKVGYEFGNSLKKLTQAYVLTKEQKYFNTSIKWMREATSWDPKGLTRINDFGDSMIMESLALAVDVFWDQLNPKDRSDILNQIQVRANGFYEHWLNYLENRNSSMHVWQHILHRLFLTSVALIDEVPDALNWLEYIYELWLAQHPKMAEEDGAWFNGTGYVRMNVMTVLDIPMKLGEFTGQNFFVAPWYGNFMKWLTYAYPPGATSDGFCNDGNKSPMPNIEYAAFADAFARITGDPLGVNYSKAVVAELDQLEEPLVNLDYTGPPLEKSILSDDKDYAWFRISKGYDMPLPLTENAVDLADSEIFPDVGVAYMNTNRTDIKNNLRVSIKSSPMGPLAHTHAEQNTFNIAYKGKRLFYNSGYRPWMGAPHTLAWYKHTQGHNGILVDQHGQPYDAGAYGFLPRFIDGEHLTYAGGDASHAYEAHELPSRSRKDNTPNDMEVKFFRRHYLLIRPNLFIVYDEMEANKPVDWSWLVHNYHGLKLNAENKTVETTYDDRGGRVTLFGAADLNYSVTDKFSVEPKNIIRKNDPNGNLLTYKNHWHFKATTKEKQEKMRFLAFIQVSDDLTYTPVTFLENTDQFQVDDWIIKANLDITTPGLITLQNQEETVNFYSSDPSMAGAAKLIEQVDGKAIVKTAKDTYPKSIISASKRNK